MEFYFEHNNKKRIAAKAFIPEGGGKHPTVIFCHGFNGNYRLLEHHGNGFAEKGIVCIFFDFCGGGLESKSDGEMQKMTIASEVADLELVVEQTAKLPYVDEDNIFLQGESMGGFVSAYVAAIMPEKVKAMVLWYPAFILPDGARERHEAGETTCFGIPLSPNFDIEAMEIDIFSIIGKYTGPVCIIHGDKDEIVPLSYSERAVECYKDASLHVIEGAGHGYDGADSDLAREYSVDFILNECNREYIERAELSIRKKFHKQLFSPFAKACKTYELIKEGDHIAVCISGGKDSMLMAKLFQEIKKHRKVNFDLTFLVMDPGYNKENRELIEHNAKKLGIPIKIFESTIFDTVDTIEKSPCYLCARMRRGYLYSKAKELGCNKIALGHHYDDVIETILMAMLHGGQIQTMMPKLHSTNFEGMELIRPLYLVREEDICKWRDYNDLHFLQCACHFTKACSDYHDTEPTASKRLDTKRLIAKLKEDNPYVEGNIFKSVENVNLSTIIAYKKDGEKHHFLDEY